MKKLNNIDKAELEQVNETVCKILIKTMTHFELNNFIESTSVSDGYRYKLRFERKKI